MNAKMNFANCLLGKPSHEALISLHDHEIKLIEVIKKTITARSKCDREYAQSLAQVVTQCLKLDAPAWGSPLYEAWEKIVNEISQLGQSIKHNAETLLSSTQSKANCLLKDKIAIKKSYVESKAMLDGELTKVTRTELIKKRELYLKQENEASLAHKSYDSLVTKGKLNNIEKAQEKYRKATLKLHNYHNDYVLQVADAQMHQKHYRNSFLPEFLTGVESMENHYIDTAKDILLEYLQLTSPCRDQFLSNHKVAEETLRSVSSNAEYKGFVATNKTPLEKEALIEFEALIGEGASLPVNHILLNTLSLQRVDYLSRTFSDDLEVIQGQIDDHNQRLIELETEIQQISQNIDKLSKYISAEQIGLISKQQEATTTRLQLVERQCLQVKQQQLHYVLNQSLQELGDRDPPPALFLPELDSISSTSSVSSSLDDRANSLKTSPINSSTLTNKMKAVKGLFRVSTKNKNFSARNEPPIFDPTKSEREQRWFHGTIPRPEVVNLLSHDGDFLLRESSNAPGELVLSSRSDGCIRHFKVQQTPDGRYKFEGSVCNSVYNLVYEHYANKLPVTKKTNCILVNPICKDKWQLSHDDISIQEGGKLGAGNFGDVFRGLLVSNNQPVAVKTCKETVDKTTREKFLMEARILKEFDHPNIVKLIGVCTDKQPVYIVMELIAGGDLNKYLKKLQQHLTTHQLVQFCKDACSGLAYLEEKKCIHRDVAARNCLVSDSSVVKITDFGMSREEEDGIYTVSGNLKSIPMRWTAPEAMDYGKFTSASDVWSFGVLSWEIFAFGRSPYPKMTNQEAREKVSQGYRMPKQSSCPQRYYGDVMLASWNADPDKRPRFAELLRTIQSILKTV